MSERYPKMVALIVDHSENQNTGHCFKITFRLKLPQIEVHVCPSIAAYQQVKEFLHSDPEKKHFLTIFDWPVKHRVEDVKSEEEATIEELWGIANDTPNPKHQYLYCIPPKEWVEAKMRACTDLFNAATRPLPYKYYDMKGGELPKMITGARVDWIAISGKVQGINPPDLTNQPA